jgi:hypothetical protein
VLVDVDAPVFVALRNLLAIGKDGAYATGKSAHALPADAGVTDTAHAAHATVLGSTHLALRGEGVLAFRARHLRVGLGSALVGSGCSRVGTSETTEN